MMKKTVHVMLFTATVLALTCAAQAKTVNANASNDPNAMTCQEYIDMNPKAMTPVAFWVVNKDTHYKDGDYVDLEDVETVSAPLLLNICHAKPESKLTQWIDKIK
jgi:acid stress chaperone HdeB